MVSHIYSLTIPSSDPAYIYLRQSFRMNHDLSLYTVSFPYEFENMGTIRYGNFPSKDAFARLIPQVTVSDRIPDSRYQMWASGRWENLSIMVEPVVVHDAYGKKVLGVDYMRGGVSGRLVNAFLRYQLKNAVIQLGRSPIWWGQSWESSIIQSGYYPPYDHVDFRFSLGNFQLELLAGQLGSEENDDGYRVKRHITGHRITWLPAHKKWIIGFGEQIIYTGVNRGIEWFYLNPVVPYFFTALEDDEEVYPTDNDNSIIFAYGRYVFKPNLSCFLEFILDEFQVDPNNSPHALGFKMGVEGGLTIKDREFSYELELSRIDTWTYIHHGDFSSWQNRGHSIGYEFGPDCWSLMVLADYWISPNILLSFKTTHLEKGDNTLDSEYDFSATRVDPFPTPPITTHQFTTAFISWHAKYGIIEAGWSNEPFPSEIANKSPLLRRGVYFKAQLIWGFGFDLE